MPREILTSFYLNTNEGGKVILTSQEDAQAKLTVYVLGRQIVSSELEMFKEHLEEDESEGLLEEDDKQMDLFDMFSNPDYNKISMEED